MSLPSLSPERLGLDADPLATADGHVAAAVSDGTSPAAVLLVSRRGYIAHLSAFGRLHPDGPDTSVDTIFDLASLTKPILAATLLTLVEEGKLLLSDKVADHIPEASAAPVGAVPLILPACHVSGLPAWRPLYESGHGKEAMLREILQTPLDYEPGTRYSYSDLGYMVLGEAIARASAMALDECVRRQVTAPLGMLDTRYLPRPELLDRIAPTANCPMRPDRVLVGEVHDANAHFFGGVAGHAGLFGTAADLAILANALIGDGEAVGHRLLGLPTLSLVRTSRIPPEVGGHSIGWFTTPNDMLPRGDLWSDRTFGHTGFTGTMVVCDPAYGLVVVLLTNRVMNSADNAGIKALRRKVLNAVASAVVEA